MNRGTFRLVFNEARGVLMAVCEFAAARGKAAGGEGRRSRRAGSSHCRAGSSHCRAGNGDCRADAASRATGPAGRGSPALLAVLLLGAAPLSPLEAAGPRPPLVRPLPVAAPNFVARGSVAAPEIAGTRMDIRQDSARAVLNWASFDIEAGHTVSFSHPNAAAATLNKIGGADPSVIRGRLESVARDSGGSGGAIFLVNRNGVLFESGAQVNVGALTASALDIADEVFENGLLSVPQGTDTVKASPVFTWQGDEAQHATTLVRVDAGAEIVTAREGRVMLLAPVVENAGSISTPQGQTILAAGDKVFLASPASGSKLRGFLVEVDPAAGGGIAENLGQIVAERGNVTLAALAVNQKGLLRATTTVDLNGSIYLQARDTVAPGVQETAADGSEVFNPLATRMGTLSFGAGSVTEVLPDTASERTLRDDQAFNRSEIRGAGKTIVLDGTDGVLAGARLRATAGEVNLTAQGDLSGNLDAFNQAPDAAARIHVGEGAQIDVAGLRDVALSVERHIVEAELRGNEFKDSPLQRSGILAGQKVLVDVREGTPLADVSGYTANLQRGIAEKSATGGDVTLRSEGDVLVRAGSDIDVSGGSLAFAGGDTGTTRLSDGRRSWSIGEASPLLRYTGFEKDTTRFEAGYVEGKDAGTLEIEATRVILDGRLHGSAVAGLKQREVADRPAGGRLVMDGLGSAVRFVNGEAALAAGFGAADPLGDTPLLLDAANFSVRGFDRLSLGTSAGLILPAEVRLELAPGGSVEMRAAQMTIDGAIQAAGGTIDLSTDNPLASSPAAAALNLGAQAVLSTAGTLVRDQRGAAPALAPLVQDGGTVTLASAGDLSLAAGSRIDVSGGVHTDSRARMRFGDAGTVELASGSLTDSAVSDAELVLGGTLEGYGHSDGRKAGAGGTLAITASSLSIGGDPLGRPGELHLDEAFFARGGFASHEITARDQLAVAPDATLRPTPQTRLATRSISSRGQTNWLPTVLAQRLRQPGSLSLTTLGRNFGDLSIGSGAFVGVDEGGRIDLHSARSILVDGTIAAPGGKIALTQDDADTKADEFLAGRGIWLGDQARLLAGGFVRLDPTIPGLRRGAVHDGGSVTMDAAKGYIVTKAGSLIDVSGSAARLDLESAATRAGDLVGSAGGSVALSAREGLLLDGAMAAAGGGDAPGGSLSVTLDNGLTEWNAVDNRNLDPALLAALAVPRRIVVAEATDGASDGLALGAAIDPFARNGRATLATETIAAAGFAEVALKSENRIDFEGPVALDVARAITLDSPNLGASPDAAVALSAAVVQLANSEPLRQSDRYREDAAGGTATLAVTADHAILEGTVTQQGFGLTTIDSRGDIETRGVSPDGTTLAGAFVSGGDIALNADRIYPTTLSDFSVEIHNRDAGTISVGRHHTAPGDDGPLLSAGGRLALVAPTIAQRGTLRAPFGALELRSERVSRIDDVETRQENPAGGAVTLADGSLTSVSGEGQTVLFGRTELSGDTWVYQTGPQSSRAIEAVPEKRVLLSADTVAKAAQATVDLSGGGELLAWEFLPGTGGSRDVLDPANAPDSYAIVPQLAAAFAAQDRQSALAGAPAPGATIEILDGIDGLAAGRYTLLPARYALLPGAFTVSFGGPRDARAGQPQALPDGSWQVAAYRHSPESGGSRRASLSEFVTLTAGAVIRSRSEYIESTAGDFFAGGASRLPGDAGRLAVRAGSSLTLAGSLDTTHAATHRGAEVDVLADRLVVRGSAAPAADYTGFVALDAAAVNGLGAESLVLGGIRERSAAGTTLAVGAAEVVLDNAGAAITAADVVLAATERVTVAADAAIEATAGAPAEDLATTGDGALLRVSGERLARLARTGVAGTRGVLAVEAGATLLGSAVTLDATADSRFAGRFRRSPEEASVVRELALGANRISLGAVPTDADGKPTVPGLTLTDARIAELGDIETLRLKSYSTVDLYGATRFGTGLQTLEVEAGGLAGRDNAAQQAVLAADRVSLANPDGVDFAAAKPAGAGSGSLRVEARETLLLGAGEFGVDGFSDTTLSAAGELLASGSGTHRNAGDLTVEAGRIAARTDARQQIAAAGQLLTRAPASATPPTAPPAAADFGGQLTLSGATLTHGGHIEMPAGRVTLRATAGDLTLADGSTVEAGGTAVDFAGKAIAVSGGEVRLESLGGQVTLAAGALVDGAPAAGAVVDVSAAGGDAGSIAIQATGGGATLAGTLRGEAADPAGRGGRFALDTQAPADLDALGAQLAAGGFDGAIAVRARQGNLELGGAGLLRAESVVLAADDGQLRIAGTIDASGAKGGDIALYANRGASADGGRLTLSGALLARAGEAATAGSGTRGEGGSVSLGVSATDPAAAENARLMLLAGSTIDVSAAPGSAAAGGRVLLRAPRVGTNEVAITGRADGALAGGADTVAVGTAITGAAKIEVEANRIYATSGDLVIDATRQTAWRSDTTAYMANAATIRSRLGFTDATAQLRPGIEARASGSITLPADWNLAAWRDGGQPGFLTLRAEQALTLNANLSDGFSALTATTVGGGESWSYRLVGGADATAADPLATAGAGAVALAAGKRVRTGTGSIAVAAGGDLVAGADATIYTAGAAGPVLPAAEFRLPHVFNAPSFPTGGGDLSLSAGGDIAFAGPTVPANTTDLAVVDWLWRQGNLALDGTLANDALVDGATRPNTAWWINFPQFRDGVGALGGGDVAIRAGGDIAGLSAAAPTNGRLAGNGVLPDAANLLVQGGGDLTVEAGGAITGGEFYAATGTMRLRAGEDFGTAAAPNVLALGNAALTVEAGRGASVGQLIDPFLAEQREHNKGLREGTVTPPALARNTSRKSYFSSYGDRSRLALTTLGGDLALRAGTVAPPTLQLAAPGGSIGLSDNLTLAPSPVGNLDLLAGDSIDLSNNGSILVSDAPVSALATPLSPAFLTEDATGIVSSSFRHANPPLHAADDQPIRIVASDGDLRGNAGQNTLILPKQAIIEAGGDIVDLGLVGQHLDADDVTHLSAGGDIVFNSPLRPDGTLATNTLGVELGGPGRLELTAGGDVDLGTSKGVVTRGNFNNIFLPDAGASVLVQAGAAQADYAGFLAWLDAPEQAAARELAGVTTLGSEAARADFLAAAGSAGALNRALFAILRGVGRAAASAGGDADYTAGYDAIEALFPAAAGPGSSSGGDFRMFFSQLKTEQGGDIDLLVPGGGVNAGLAVAGRALDKNASQLGIVTARGGSVRAMVRDDFAVNQSRVFTLQGGDILIWSSEGDIDAGKGAKTTSTTPPPQIIVRGDQIILDTSNSVGGSGIGVLLGKDGIEPGSVDLIAPKGAVIAGEAGIRALGDIFLAGAQVIGADNIQAGGNQVGVPAVEAAAAPPPPPPPAADAARAAEQATNTVAQNTRRGDAASSILTVEVLALGEEDEEDRQR
jgi:filamentous hemagglutinin family protein